MVSVLTLPSRTGHRRPAPSPLINRLAAAYEPRPAWPASPSPLTSRGSGARPQPPPPPIAVDLSGPPVRELVEALQAGAPGAGEAEVARSREAGKMVLDELKERQRE